MIGRVAVRPARERWRCSRHVEMEGNCRVQVRRHRAPRRRDVGISTDRRSRERRSAGLEGCAPHRDERSRGNKTMFDPLEGDGQRQLRRGRNERRTQQRNSGADRTIIVGVARRWICRFWLRMVCRRRGRCDARRAVAENIRTVDMAEREDELHRQREQRQTTAENPVRPKPPHYTNSRLPTQPRQRQLRACRPRYNENACPAGANDTRCGMEATLPGMYQRSRQDPASRTPTAAYERQEVPTVFHCPARKRRMSSVRRYPTADIVML
jgi:hypothetical protein